MEQIARGIETAPREADIMIKKRNANPERGREIMLLLLFS